MRDLVLSELQFSTGLVLSGEEVVPQFLVNGDDGAWTIFAPLPDGDAKHARVMRLVAGFMAWKLATSFVMSGELFQPELVHAIGVSADTALAAGRVILRQHKSVGPIQWLPESAIGDEILRLLPRGRIIVDDATMEILRRTFGAGGEFEARRLN